MLIKHPQTTDYIYTVDDADIRGGRLTILGCPTEYPNHQLRMIMGKYADNQSILVKDGYYRNYPRIRNVGKHAIFKKLHRPIPNFLTLPEGIGVKVRHENQDQKAQYNHNRYTYRNEGGAPAQEGTRPETDPEPQGLSRAEDTTQPKEPTKHREDNPINSP